MKQSDVVYLSSMRLRRYAEQTRYGLVVVDEAQREVPTQAAKPAIDSHQARISEGTHNRVLVMGKPFDRRSYGGSQ
jgi:hypothetical protein